MDLLFTLVVFFGGLTLLVFIHELGHYLPAKLFGMRVEKFYIFFDWPRKIWSTQRGGTEFGIGMLPIGGYVKIGGMIDESVDEKEIQKEQAGVPPQPDDFRAKPVWQRMIVMVGGVTFNVILGILIFSGLAYVMGDARVRLDKLPHGIEVAPGTVGADLGLQTGDRIVGMNGEPLTYLPDGRQLQRLLLSENGRIEVERGGQRVSLPVPIGYLDRLSGPDRPELVLGLPDPDAVIVVADSASPAARAGLKTGDRIVSIEGQAVTSFAAMRSKLAGKANAPVALVALRGADTVKTTAVLDTASRLQVGADRAGIPIERVEYGLLESVGVGAVQAFRLVGDQISGFRKIFAGEVSASKAVAGPVKIAQFMGDAARQSGAAGFWVVVGMLSMILAFVNILPIPALDGGHLVFLLIEAVTRREPSLKVRLVAQQIGMTLLLLLMVFVLFNDTLRMIWS